MSAGEREKKNEKWRQREYLYAILNLPVSATEAEIKERHRSLSLVFHPDKQRDERTKEVAMEKFLEIQGAYEVLSDPFRREIYDTLGYDGLNLRIPSYFQYLPPDELRSALRSFLLEARAAQLESLINSTGTLTCALDARELFYDGWLAREWYTDLSERVAATRFSIVSLRHSLSRQIGPQTKVQIIGRAGQSEGDEDLLGQARREGLFRGNVVGVIRHQYSPKIQLEAQANLIRTRFVRLGAVYSDGLNSLSVHIPVLTSLSSFVLSPVELNFNRRLFRDTLTVGGLAFNLNPVSPTVGITLTKPAIAPKDEAFAAGWTCGLNMRVDVGPTLFGFWTFVFSRLAADVQFGFEYSLIAGIASRLEGAWRSEGGGTNASATVLWSMRGVQLRMVFSHLGQTLVLPITLADDYAPRVALVAALLPGTAFALYDYFSLRSRRASKRNARLLEHRRAQEDHFSEKRSEAEMASSLLKDTAKRTVQAEKDSDGLIILEASYFPIEENGQPMPDLGLDVTVPIQALVHSGQLFVPGNRPKSTLRGFYDPLPECKKRLSIRYEFHGRLHYAEVADFAPVALPLESHLVEDSGKL